SAAPFARPPLPGHALTVTVLPMLSTKSARRVPVLCTRLTEEPSKRQLVTLPLGSETVGSCGDIFDSTLRSEEHTSELQSRENLVCRLLLEKNNNVFSVRHRQILPWACP